MLTVFDRVSIDLAILNLFYFHVSKNFSHVVLINYSKSWQKKISVAHQAKVQTTILAQAKLPFDLQTWMHTQDAIKRSSIPPEKSKAYLTVIV